MNNVEELANEVLTHSIQIDMLVAHIEDKFPGKTLAELLVEGIFG